MDKREHQIVPVPEPGTRFEDQSELILLAQTVLGEAEGESYLGKLGVANCVMNRTRDPRWGNTVQEVALQKWQFSCFNAGSPRIMPMMRPSKHVSRAIWRDCIKASTSAMFHFEEDPSMGADHYLVTSIKDSTSWSKGRQPVAIIGNHSYYQLSW